MRVPAPFAPREDRYATPSLHEMTVPTIAVAADATNPSRQWVSIGANGRSLIFLLSLQWQRTLGLLLLHFNRLSSRGLPFPGSTVGNVCEILPLVAPTGT